MKMERKLSLLHNRLWLMTTMGLAIICLIVVPESVKAQSNTFPTSGSVGIGTTSPQTTLHIAGDGTARRGIKLEQTTAGTTWSLNNYETSSGEGAGKFGINLVGSGNKL